MLSDAWLAWNSQEKSVSIGAARERNRMFIRRVVLRNNTRPDIRNIRSNADSSLIAIRCNNNLYAVNVIFILRLDVV